MNASPKERWVRRDGKESLLLKEVPNVRRFRDWGRPLTGQLNKAPKVRDTKLGG